MFPAVSTENLIFFNNFLMMPATGTVHDVNTLQQCHKIDILPAPASSIKFSTNYFQKNERRVIRAKSRRDDDEYDVTEEISPGYGGE